MTPANIFRHGDASRVARLSGHSAPSGDNMIDFRHADAFDLGVGLPSLAAESVDLVLTDPPFDRRTHRACLESKDWHGADRKADAPLPFEPFGTAEIEKAAREFVRLVRPGGWIVTFSAEEQVGEWITALQGAGASFQRLGAALRANPRPQLDGRKPSCGYDPLVICSKGSATWNGRGRAGVWRSPAARHDPGGQQHPTQKSVELMQKLIEDFTNRGELVLDCFAGSATTAVAAKVLGRRFVGFEVSSEYYAAALKRIEMAREQLALFQGGLAL